MTDKAVLRVARELAGNLEESVEEERVWKQQLKNDLELLEAVQQDEETDLELKKKDERLIEDINNRISVSENGISEIVSLLEGNSEITDQDAEKLSERIGGKILENLSEAISSVKELQKDQEKEEASEQQDAKSIRLEREEIESSREAIEDFLEQYGGSKAEIKTMIESFEDKAERDGDSELESLVAQMSGDYEDMENLMNDIEEYEERLEELKQKVSSEEEREAELDEEEAEEVEAEISSIGSLKEEARRLSELVSQAGAPDTLESEVNNLIDEVNQLENGLENVVEEKKEEANAEREASTA